MRFVKSSFIATLLVLFASASFAQDGKAVYSQIKAFSLSGGKAEVNNLTLKRDRFEINLSGTVYFPEAVAGKVTGAVFIGKGTFKAEAPNNEFERANLKRLIGVETGVESDFTTAVMRFSDDTASAIGTFTPGGAAPADAQKLASEIDDRVLEETGASLSGRVALSLLNRDSGGFFFAMFDGGKRGRFSCLLDPQNRIPTDYFGINGGEKGLIFKYDSALKNNDVWLAFYSQTDYANGRVAYSDNADVIDVIHYDMDIDVTEPKKKLALKTRLKAEARFDGVKALPFLIGESLGEGDDTRLEKQMMLKGSRIDGKDVPFTQEKWEGGFTLFPANEIKKGQPLEIELDLEGDFLQQPQHDISYPRSNSSWYPRHGYLDRSTFSMRFRHAKNLKIGSVGTRKSEVLTEDAKMSTVYEMPQPVALVTFAVGPFKRHTEMIKWDKGGKPTPLEFNSLDHLPIEEPLMMAEMNNSVRYFHQLFGDYPYETYSATYHPYNFGQGFPSMLVVPATNYADKNTYSFISHETAHQWWGNIVAWRSYRDQWLSEGFAEYSGVVYTNLRKNTAAGRDLIDDMRDSLKRPPQTLSGIGKGRLSDIGPLILGHRLSSKKTLGGYQTLVYNKGALVLRMLHYLFTDPTTGSGDPFYAMMRDFVSKYRNSTASTDDFRAVANEHFVRTPIAKQYQMQDLNWFFRQWVYQSHLPSYRMEHTLEDQPDGSCLVTGNVIQENTPEEWVMPLPVVFKFGGDQVGQATVIAYGAKRPFKLKLPVRPKSIELDPARWVLSEKTSTK